MNAQITSKEKNVVNFTFEVGPEKLEEGMKYSYNKNKGKIAVAGFRKGKAPRQVIEAQYGAETLYEDAINFVLNTEYEIALDELKLDVVSRPDIDVKNIGKAVGISFTAEVTVKPEVKLGQYRGLEVPKTVIEITDEEIEAELKKIQEENSRIIVAEDRTVADGDIVNISYKGTIDGVAFEGGAADSYDLTIGSHSFIDTFEDQIIGHVKGDAFDVLVTFPEKYHDDNLAGKPAVFAVEVKEISIKELPTIDDEFAQDVSDFDTLDEYKASIVDKITKDKEAKNRQTRGDLLLDLAIANAEMDVPEIMVENKIDQLLKDFEENMNRQGITLDMYCQFSGKSVDDFKETFRGTAKKSVDARLILEKIAIEENIAITKEEVDAEIVKYGEESGIDGEKMLEYFQDNDREALEKDIAVHKAIEILHDTAVEI